MAESEIKAGMVWLVVMASLLGANVAALPQSFEDGRLLTGWVGVLTSVALVPSLLAVLRRLRTGVEERPAQPVHLVTHASPDDYAAAFNDGFDTAHAQELADDPSVAQDWLDARDEETRRAERERCRAELAEHGYVLAPAPRVDPRWQERRDG